MQGLPPFLQACGSIFPWTRVTFMQLWSEAKSWQKRCGINPICASSGLWFTLKLSEIYRSFWTKTKFALEERPCKSLIFQCLETDCFWNYILYIYLTTYIKYIVFRNKTEPDTNIKQVHITQCHSEHLKRKSPRDHPSHPGIMGYPEVILGHLEINLGLS